MKIMRFKRRYGRPLVFGLILGALLLANLFQYTRISQLGCTNEELESSNENLRIINRELENEVDGLKEKLAYYENIFENMVPGEIP